MVCEMAEEKITASSPEKNSAAQRDEDYVYGTGHSVKSCVSDFRQSQVWCCGNSAESGPKPFHTYGPGGWGGMCAGGVNAVPNAGTVYSNLQNS